MFYARLQQEVDKVVCECKVEVYHGDLSRHLSSQTLSIDWGAKGHARSMSGGGESTGRVLHSRGSRRSLHANPNGVSWEALERQDLQI